MAQMTPGQYERSKKKSLHYGFHFDPDVDKYLPPGMRVDEQSLRWLTGPLQYPKRGKMYYQSQCAFRSLPTKGTIVELERRLKSRDKSKDAAIKAEQARLVKSIRSHDKAVAREAAEPWWQDPARTLDEKVSFNPLRALKESLDGSNLLKTSCHVLRRSIPGLRKAALSLNLAHEKVYSKPGEDGCRMYLGDLVGQAEAMEKKAAELHALAAEEERQVEAQRMSDIQAKKDRQKAEQRKLLAEAMRMPDWDPTGTWSIHCEKLSTYTGGTPEKLSMQIWRDDFRFDKTHEDDDYDADKEIEEDHNYLEDYEDEDEEEMENYPWGKPSRYRERPEKDAHLPRFCAKFDFAVVEGIMRIFPRAIIRRRCPPDLLVENNPKFDYVWRGRETGEGEIQVPDKTPVVQSIEFTDYATELKGVFKCSFMEGNCHFTSIKLTHGHGKLCRSSNEWAGLGEEAWGSACAARWR